MTTKPTFAWHVHHEILVEPLTEPLKNRIKYIKEEKPKEEVPLRLKLLRKVKGKLPSEVVRTWDTYNKAWDVYEKALQANMPAILALHAKECEPDCPWNGKTIFPKV